MTPQQRAVAYAVESLVIAKEYGQPDEYAIACAIAELHALSPACTRLAVTA